MKTKRPIGRPTETPTERKIVLEMIADIVGLNPHGPLGRRILERKITAI